MKFKKLLSITVATLLAVSVVGCSSKKKESNDEQIKLTFFNTSAEVNTMFEDMFKRYNELNPNVVIELIPTGIGEGQQEKLQSLYASGNAPSIMNVDPANIIEYMPKLLEFTSTNAKWTQVANNGVVEAGTFDGKLLGMPFSVQGYGLVYNKRVVNEIYGEDFNPSSINTQDALFKFFEKIDAAGVAPVLLHGANWSLGGHYLTLAYAAQGPETSDGTDFIENIKNGTQKIEDSEIFNGYIDTLDQMIKYNYNKQDPLVGDYDRDVQAIGNGEAATMFIGDWMWTVMATLDGVDKDYGFIPIPWSNDSSAYGNSEVVMVLPKFSAVDKSQTTEAEQQAALDFLGWMLTESEGQQFLLDAGFAMPYSNIGQDIKYNTMTESIAEYVDNEKTINLGVFSYISGDAWTETGNLMLKYVAGVIDRQELADGINEYWRSLD